MQEGLLDLAPPPQTICKSLGLWAWRSAWLQSRYSNCTCLGLSFLPVNDSLSFSLQTAVTWSRGTGAKAVEGIGPLQEGHAGPQPGWLTSLKNLFLKDFSMFISLLVPAHRWLKPVRDKALTWKIDYLYESAELLRMNGIHCLSSLWPQRLLNLWFPTLLKTRETLKSNVVCLPVTRDTVAWQKSVTPAH